MKTGDIDRMNRIYRMQILREGSSCRSPVKNPVRPVHPVKKKSERAFTMIEIAIAVGVIGFALVAIIGILPMGMNSQKDNREETTISQDAPYFLNAIRNGEIRTNSFVFGNFVESITVSNLVIGNLTYNNPNLVGGGNAVLTNDSNIIGLLGTPEYDPRFNNNGSMYTNTVTATVRAMSGSAAMQGGSGTNMAFRYQVTVENVPWNSVSYDSTNWNNSPPINSCPYAQGMLEWTNRYNRWLMTQYLTNSLHEVRLKFAWPVLPNGNIGPNRATYRTYIGSYLWFSNNLANGTLSWLWYYQPQLYTNNIYNTGWL